MKLPLVYSLNMKTYLVRYLKNWGKNLKIEINKQIPSEIQKI